MGTGSSGNANRKPLVFLVLLTKPLEENLADFNRELDF